MSIHKLTAGSGYDYLTRQVAAQDATEKGHTSLASYYSAKGEAPGTWIGSGVAGIDGLHEGDEVTAEQMRNLFGAGKHPLAEQLRAAAAGAGLSEREQETATWLGNPFRVYANDTSAFRIRVARGGRRPQRHPRSTLRRPGAAGRQGAHSHPSRGPDVP
ncbi:relaxase domain-containing protein [Cellulomonas sp. P24]|uniref:relaxase domain-containing protein n=1 Tax=Cellulomonas sp. P24 TaxID=2885206 RepID=UPI00216AFA75|nr:relaxase domain-containing protein [Cellulomonas sp. P24]MCR6490900.1 relaxase domain-containing protein [Cellulomonas sp. P24]